MNKYLLGVLLLCFFKLSAKDRQMLLQAQASAEYGNIRALLDACSAQFHSERYADSCRKYAIRTFAQTDPYSPLIDSIFFQSSQNGSLLLEYAVALSARSDYDNTQQYLIKYLKQPNKVNKPELLLTEGLSQFWKSSQGRFILKKDWYSSEENALTEYRYLLEKGDFDGAFLLFDSLDQAHLLFYKALFFYAQGDLHKALKLSKEFSLQSRSYEENILLQAQLCFALKRYEESIKAYDLLYKSGVGYQYFYEEYITAILQTGEAEVAVDVLLQLIRFFKNDSGLYLYLSYAKEDLKQHLDALAFINKAIQLSPACVSCYLQRASVFETLGYSKKAISDLTMALDIYPFSAETLVNRGKLRVALGDGSGACADFKRAAMYGNKEAVRLFSACDSGQ